MYVTSTSHGYPTYIDYFKASSDHDQKHKRLELRGDELYTTSWYIGIYAEYGGGEYCLSFNWGTECIGDCNYGTCNGAGKCECDEGYFGKACNKRMPIYSNNIRSKIN